MNNFKALQSKKAIKLTKITPQMAQQIWLLPDLNDKKLVLLDFIGTDCNTTEEMKIRQKIQNSRNGDQINQIITNMMLKADGFYIR